MHPSGHVKIAPVAAPSHTSIPRSASTPTEPREHGMGEVPAEAGRRPGEGLPAGEPAVAGAHQGPAQRAGPEQLLPQQRCAGRPAPGAGALRGRGSLLSLPLYLKNRVSDCSALVSVNGGSDMWAGRFGYYNKRNYFFQQDHILLRYEDIV